MLPVHFYTLQGLGGHSYGVAPLLPVDAVHDAHQAGVPLAVHVVEEGELDLARGDDVSQHDSCPFVAVSLPVHFPGGAHDGGVDFQRAVGVCRELYDAAFELFASAVAVEAVGHDEYGYIAAAGTLFPQFLHGHGAEHGCLGGEFVQVCNLLGECPGDHDLFLRLGGVLEADAGYAVEFLPCPDSADAHLRIDP